MPPKIARFDPNEEPIEGYVLVDFLGKGQFGEVWKARDKASGKLVAIKIIDLTFSPTALKELRAFKLVKNLNHPNLVPILTARLKNLKDKEVDFDNADKLPKGTLKELVIAMGLGEKSLAERLKQVNPDGTLPDERQGLPVTELIRYFRGAAKGIDFLNQQDHGLGSGDGPIVHCDIKPENMMIVSGEVQIADCGVAVIIAPDMRQTRAAGSPAYSAPELSGNKPVPGTDQYSLAISYYELRTGHLPFPDEAGLQQIILAHALGDLDFSSPVITPAERDILKKATARVPADRYDSCEEFIDELSQLPEIRAAAKAAKRPGSRAGTSGDVIDLTPAEEARRAGGSRPAMPGLSDPDRPRPASQPAVPIPPIPSKPRPGSPPPPPAAPTWKAPVAEAPKPAPSEKRPYSGTINFNDLIPDQPRDVETPAPTPYLPFPDARVATPPPGGAPATADGPDVSEILAALKSEPTKPPPGLRETTVPPAPATETPRAEDKVPFDRKPRGPAAPEEARDKQFHTAVPDESIMRIIAESQGVRPAAPRVVPPPPEAPKPPPPAEVKKPDPPKPAPVPPTAAPARKGGGGGVAMPVDPNDPLGKVYPTAMPDDSIIRIIGQSQAVNPPAARQVPPPPPQPAKPSAPQGEGDADPSWLKKAKEVAKVAKPTPPAAKPQRPAPPPPAPATAQEPDSKPTWYREGQAQSGNGTKPHSAVQSKPGNWRHDPESKAVGGSATGGKGKLIAGLAVGVVVVGTVAAIMMRGGNGPTPTNTGEITEKPRSTGSGNGSSSGTNASGTNPPPDTSHKEPINNSTTAFDEKLNALEQADASNAAFTTAIKDAFARADGDLTKKVRVAATAVAKAPASVSAQTAIWAAVKQGVAATEIGAANVPGADTVRATVPKWFKDKLRASYKSDVELKYVALAAAPVSTDDVEKAKDAVKLWLEAADATRKDIASLNPDGLKIILDDTAEEYLRAWYDAVTESERGPKFEELKAKAKTATNTPAARVLAFEYFRLANGTDALADARTVRDHVKASWGDEAVWKPLDTAFQVRLATWVKSELDSDRPKYKVIADECGGDPANGWAAAAAAESLLGGPAASPTAQAAVKRISAQMDDKQLAAFVTYLKAITGGSPDAAANLIAAYNSPDTILGRDARRSRAATLIYNAALSNRIPAPPKDKDNGFLEALYPAGEKARTSAELFAAADRVRPAADTALAIPVAAHLIASCFAASNALPEKTDEFVKRFEWPLRKSLADWRERAAVCLALSAPAAKPEVRLLARGELAVLGAERLDALLSKSTSDEEDNRLRKDKGGYLLKEVIGPALSAPTELNDKDAKAAVGQLRFVRAKILIDGYRLEEYKKELATVGSELKAALEAAPPRSPFKAQIIAYQGFDQLIRVFEDPTLTLKPKDVSADARVKFRSEWKTLLNLAATAKQADDKHPAVLQLSAIVGQLDVGLPSWSGINLLRDDPGAELPASRYIDVADRMHAASVAYEKVGSPHAGHAITSGDYHFKAVLHLVERGEITRTDAASLLTRAADSLEKAMAVTPRLGWVGMQRRGLLLEDAAWIGGGADAKSLFAKSIAGLNAAVEVADNQNTRAKDEFRVGLRTDLGRAQLRMYLFAGRDKALLNQAAEELETATRIGVTSPRVAEAYYWLGKVRWEQEKYSAAEEAFDACLKVAVQGAGLWHDFTFVECSRMLLAQATDATDESWKSLADRAKALADRLDARANSSPDVTARTAYSFAPYYLRGWVLVLQREYEKALEEFKKGETAAAAYSGAGAGRPILLDTPAYADFLQKQIDLAENAAAPKSVRDAIPVDALRERIRAFKAKYPWQEPPTRR